VTHCLASVRGLASFRCAGMSVLPLCLLLSACGGDGAFIASIPPPPVTPTPTPTPTPAPTASVQTSWLDSPATRAGTYNVIGRLTLTPGNGQPTSYRAGSSGEFTFTASQPAPTSGFNYILNVPVGILPASLTSIRTGGPVISWDINLPPAQSYHYDDPYEDYVQYLGQQLTASTGGSGMPFLSYDFTRGQTQTIPSLSANANLRTILDYDIGYSYVAMGEWSWRVVDLNGAAVPGSDSGDLLFVNGDRTSSSGIPVSGTATYDAHTLKPWSNGAAGIPFALMADFGARTIATRIDQDYRYTGGVDPATLGIHVGGSAPFSNDGLFDIPLAGTANYSSTNSSVTPPDQPVPGDMNGAFFGPHAEQVGGTFSLQNSTGVQLMQDAFVGQQHHP